MSEDLQQAGFFVPENLQAGDPEIVGNMAVVLLCDPDNHGLATCALFGTYRLLVEADRPIQIEAPLYLDRQHRHLTDNPKSGSLFGYAMAEMAAESNEVIPVRLKQ